MTVFQALLLFVAFLVAGFLGIHFSKYLGRWAMLPAIILGLVLALLACAGLIRSFLKARHTGQNKK